MISGWMQFIGHYYGVSLINLLACLLDGVIAGRHLVEGPPWMAWLFLILAVLTGIMAVVAAVFGTVRVYFDREKRLESRR